MVLGELLDEFVALLRGLDRLAAFGSHVVDCWRAADCTTGIVALHKIPTSKSRYRVVHVTRAGIDIKHTWRCATEKMCFGLLLSRCSFQQRIAPAARVAREQGSQPRPALKRQGSRIALAVHMFTCLLPLLSFKYTCM